MQLLTFGFRINRLFPERKRLGQLMFVLIFIFPVLYFYCTYKTISRQNVPKFKSSLTTFCKTGNCDDVTLAHEAPEEAVCKIPELDPYDQSIQHLLFRPPDPKCELSTTRLFNATLESKLIPTISLDQFRAKGIGACCYRIVIRVAKKGIPDDGYRLSEGCYRVNLDSPTEVKPKHEFIAIFCRGGKDGSRNITYGYKPSPREFIDLKAFVHLKENKKGRLAKVTRGPKLSVAIFGFDAVSRLNFVRTMPKSRKYLMEEMGAIEMTGYNKVGSNTLPNLAALLTNMKLGDMERTCVKHGAFDDCPFIWKNFSKSGYLTAFVEDLSTMAIFNRDGHTGFRDQPTDYYFRHFTLAANDFFRKRQGGRMTCYGHRLFLEVLLEYMTTFIWKMGRERKPFFYLSWEGSLTHDELNDAELGDEPTLTALKRLKEGDLLNETVLIVASDHGMRFGPIQYYRQGQFEDMLPLLYIVLPKWFQQTYPKAYQNLRGNSKRFMTTLDLYFTLRDILDPGVMQDREIERWGKELTKSAKNGRSIPKGISLFLPIPPERTCRHTIIDPTYYCVCSQYEIVNDTKRLKNIRVGALFAVKAINRMLAPYPICVQLRLGEVMLAQRRMEAGLRAAYLINFRTIPGHGEFQALVERKGMSGLWSVSGNVARTNLYGNQSACVEKYRDVREFCFCKVSGSNWERVETISQN